MKLLLLMLLLAAPVMGQDLSARTAAGCGPDETKFDVKTVSNKDALAQPNPGQALIYFIGEIAEKIACAGCPTTVRIGLDGTWTAAIKGDSYVSFAVNPGEHHLCSGWQVSRTWGGTSISAVSVSAEPGKTYYFLTEIHYGMVDPLKKGPFVELHPVDNAEGQALISSRKLSTFRPKK